MDKVSNCKKIERLERTTERLISELEQSQVTIKTQQENVTRAFELIEKLTCEIRLITGLIPGPSGAGNRNDGTADNRVTPDILSVREIHRKPKSISAYSDPSLDDHRVPEYWMKQAGYNWQVVMATDNIKYKSSDIMPENEQAFGAKENGAGVAGNTVGELRENMDESPGRETRLVDLSDERLYDLIDVTPFGADGGCTSGGDDTGDEISEGYNTGMESTYETGNDSINSAHRSMTKTVVEFFKQTNFRYEKRKMELTPKARGSSYCDAQKDLETSVQDHGCNFSSHNSKSIRVQRGVDKSQGLSETIRVREYLPRLGRRLRGPLQLPFTWDVYMGRNMGVVSSEEFYASNGGYKMCLKMDYGLAWCVLKKGKHDPFLKWPWEGDLELVVVNRETRQVLSKSRQVDDDGRERPTDHCNMQWLYFTDFDCDKKRLAVSVIMRSAF